MLNLVPLQFLALFGYAILRIVVGFVWLELAFRHKQDISRLKESLRLPLWPWPKAAVVMIIITEFVIGGLFIIGLFTQILGPPSYFSRLVSLSLSLALDHQRLIYQFNMV